MVEHLLINKHMKRKGKAHRHRERKRKETETETHGRHGEKKGDRGDSNRPVILSFKILM